MSQCFISKKILVTVLFFFMMVLSAIFCISRASTFRFDGLKGEVSIIFDKHGIPYITAEKDDNDVAFALGYIHAYERLWQMDFDRRLVKGTLSEIFGKKTLEADKLLRSWGLYKAATRNWKALEKSKDITTIRTTRFIKAYTNGVNAYIAKMTYLKTPLPALLTHDKIDSWRPEDTLAWQKMMAWNLEDRWVDKLRNALVVNIYGKSMLDKILPPYPDSGPVVVPENAILYKSGNKNHEADAILLAQLNKSRKDTALLTAVLNRHVSVRNMLDMRDTPSGKGSNSWVVSGKISQTGLPILANDPHLDLRAPSLWYFARLKGPGLDVAGATFPGVPMVIIGHNAHIGWGVTSSFVDNQDLFFEKKQDLEKENETIHVKGESPVIFPVLSSSHGPVISETGPGKELKQGYMSIKWPALEADDTTLVSYYSLNYAHNWQDFKKAMKYYVSPIQNFIYADTQGHIGYILPGKIPVRNGYSGRFPVKSRANPWKGYIPFDELPVMYDPPQNFIVTANNKIVSDAYPYILNTRWSIPPYRAERITRMIQGNKKNNSVKTMSEIQLDTLSNRWVDLRELLLSINVDSNASKNAMKSLKKWNGRMELESSEATIFAYWYREIAKALTAEMRELPEDVAEWIRNSNPLFIKHQLESEGQFCRLGIYSSCRSLLEETLQLSIKKLIADYGHDKSRWQWRHVHKACFKELGVGQSSIGFLWNRSISAPGGNDTVNVGAYNTQSFNERHGPSYRQVIDMSDLSKSQFIQPMGQANFLLSGHYNDLSRKWAEGKYVEIKTPKSGKKWRFLPSKTDVLEQ